MTNYQTVSEKTFKGLDKGTQSFEFMTITHNKKDIAVVVIDVKDHSQDELELTIEPIYQVEPDFPKQVVISSALYDWTMDPLTNPIEINKLLSYFLRTQIKSSHNKKRENALFAGFAYALDSTESDSQF